MPLTREFVESSIVEDYAIALGPLGAARSLNPLTDISPRPYLNAVLLEALWALGLDAADRNAVADTDLDALDDVQVRQYILAVRITLVNKLLPSLRFKLSNQSSRNSRWDLKPIVDGLVDDLKSMKVDYITVSAEAAGLSVSGTGIAVGQPPPTPWAGRAGGTW
jgi:hypothetical protein